MTDSCVSWTTGRHIYVFNPLKILWSVSYDLRAILNLEYVLLTECFLKLMDKYNG